MKQLRIPVVSTESLNNSLFESITFDAKATKRGAIEPGPKLVNIGLICLCLRGSGTFVINDTSYNVQKGSLITLLPNTLIQATSSSDDFLGYAIAASTQFMMNLQMSNAMRSYLYVSANPVLQITEEQMESILEVAEMLKRKRDERDHPFSKEISRNLMMVLCYEVHALYRARISEGREVVEGRTRQGAICQEFLMLVEKYASEHREMGFYADTLCITPKYLSVVVKKVSGRSPVEWIDSTVMRYARTLLTSSDMTVQQISAELNFPNPSFFGQYFKRHEGITPKQFRKLRVEG